MSEKEMCSCGFPQSYPVPHQHDWTEREKAIAKQIFKELEKEFEGIDVGDGYPIEDKIEIEIYKKIKAKFLQERT